MSRVLIFLLLAKVAFAQQPLQPLKIGNVIVQASVRTRLETWDWFPSDADGAYPYSGTLARIAFTQSKKQFDWQLEFAAPVLLGLPDSAVAPGPQGALGFGANYYTSNHRQRNAAMIFAKQGFVRFKGLFRDDSQSLRLGRFEFLDGSEIVPKNASLAVIKRDRIAQRLIGNFGWSHVGRSLDGFHYIANKPKFSFHLLGALPTRGAFQVDGWGPLRVGILYASLNGQHTNKSQSGDWRLFGLFYDDWRHLVKTDTANIRIGTIGGHYLHAVQSPRGTVDLMLWAVYQTGKWRRLDHRASAAAVEAGWQPPVLPRLKPWIRGGYFHSTGDANPNDNRHDTFFQVLPTPRPFARFPFFNLMNNEDFQGMLTLRPHPAWTIKSEFHALRLSERNDQWYAGGGAFQPWTLGYTGRPSGGARGLANLYDVSADWNVTPRLALSFYYAHATGRSVIHSLYPKGANANFGYVELTKRF